MRVLVLLVTCYLSSCLTPNKERQLNADIYNLQQRTFELEKRLLEKNDTQIKTSETTKKKIASTTTTLEKYEIEIQKLKGDIDALKVGVRTGQIPGEEVEEGTLIYTINDILSRLENVEEAQAELLTAIRGDKKNKKSSKKTSNTSVKNLAELEKLFDRKLYPKVVKEAPTLVKKTKKKSSKERIKFLQAESLYKLGKLRDAALQFNEFLDSKPSKEHTAHAKLRMGDCFRHLGDTATSRVYYSELIEEFPDSDQAELAEKRLEKLKKRG